MGDQNIITEVPAALKRLAKYMVRGFYGVEYSLALDVLIRYPCVKEDALLQLLKYERKQLRTILNTLKADKFIKLRMRVETGPNGKSTRHNYYYINYKVLVDVVRYKLDHIRRKIEADERDSTTRSSFKCPSCFNTYTDLEETEDVVLPYDLLEPPPTEIPELSESFDQKIYSNVLDTNIRPEKWANKNSSLSDMYVQNLVIDVQDSEPKKEKEKVAKEQPIWMSQSTVEEASSAVDTNAEIPKTDENVKESVANNEVIKTLLIHESKSSSGTRHVPPLAQSKCHESESDTSESEEDIKHVKPGKVVGSDLEQEEQETVDPTVMVAGQPHLYSEVSENPVLVSFMTGEEREAYIKVGQEMFQSVFE
ncbi:general transcription factor IIE subunit 1-like isoform X2 [Alligator sinensis]|uniref:General transcription factor IIE subunit 1-like isoform X2 n=1 Tax=Alligator sinensis TaxID=38654 RepID=A0A1U7R9H8_ALLSI|nr:general transcription factor IIE subunit 1-like isoform X2 [Alligator sinensis]